jgi:hypothetical protein
MDLKDILGSKDRQMVFNTVLDEACRQWCDFLSEAPERMDGEGFAEFFYGVFQDKEDEYIQEAKEAAKSEEPRGRASVIEKLRKAKTQDTACPDPGKNKKIKQHGMEL